MLISTQEPSPAGLCFGTRPASSSSSSSSPSASSSVALVTPGLQCYYSTSAFTPTIASVPSTKHTLALPLAAGRILKAAIDWACDHLAAPVVIAIETREVRRALQATARTAALCLTCSIAATELQLLQTFLTGRHWWGASGISASGLPRQRQDL
jgi:hypothetical protein